MSTSKTHHGTSTGARAARKTTMTTNAAQGGLAPSTSPFAQGKPRRSGLTRTRSKQVRAARARLARQKSRSMRTQAAMSGAVPVSTRRTSSGSLEGAPSLGRRRGSLGDRLHSTNPLASAPSAKAKLNRRAMLALHFQSFVANRGDPIAALNPVTGAVAGASQTARNAAEVVTTSMDVLEAFEEKVPLKQLSAKDVAMRLAKLEAGGMKTPFAL